MQLSKLQQQFLKDLLDHKESNKSVIITKYYRYANNIVAYEFTIQGLLKMPLGQILNLVTPNKDGVVTYCFPRY